MLVLTLMIPMNSDECVDNKEGILKALRVLAAYTSVDITDEEMLGLMPESLDIHGGKIADDAYEIVEA